MAIVFFVGAVIFWLVIAIMGFSGRFDNLSETDDENEKKVGVLVVPLFLLYHFF